MSQTDGFQEENDHEECSGGTEESNSDALNDDEFNPTEGNSNECDKIRNRFGRFDV